MAKNSLTQTGKVLGLVGGIIGIIEAVLSLIDRPLVRTPIGNVVDTGELLINVIVHIILAVLLILICNDRVSIGNRLVLSIIVIILGLLIGGIGGLLGIIGGILILIDELS